MVVYSGRSKEVNKKVYKVVKNWQAEARGTQPTLGGSHPVGTRPRVLMGTRSYKIYMAVLNLKPSF